MRCRRADDLVARLDQLRLDLHGYQSLIFDDEYSSSAGCFRTQAAGEFRQSFSFAFARDGILDLNQREADRAAQPVGPILDYCLASRGLERALDQRRAEAL